jgi:chromosome segregation ATPase
VAYKVNRGWIKENQALLAEHKKELEQIATGIAAVKGDLSAQGTGLGDLKQRLVELDDLTAKVEGVTAGQDKLAKNIADIDTRALTERVIRNEQAVSAIDAYRVQLNRRLTELQGRVDAMGPVASP